jgi:hypothetical protein
VLGKKLPEDADPDRQKTAMLKIDSTQSSITAAAGIPPHEQGIASGMASTTLWIGGATGLAILVVIAGHPSAIGTTLTLLQNSRSVAFGIASGITLCLPVAFLTSRAATDQTAVVPR